ncbi:MAG: hypothetical protein L6R40_003879 [Gallowayella cf. fulva]|nr:MAG: hypothetical protein L6R40_003879 [Xanthomendoza cf. fulva]
MLRSLPRAAHSSAPFRAHPHRIRTQSSHLPAATWLLEGRQNQRRHAGIHAISNPTLAGIEKRWEGMPPQEQADLWMALRDRMKVDWHEMTLQEKKAACLSPPSYIHPFLDHLSPPSSAMWDCCLKSKLTSIPNAAYWIAFGPHGPRSLPPPGEGKRVFWYTVLGCAASIPIFFLIRTQAKPPPRTMTAQYQAMSNEYLKVTITFLPETPSPPRFPRCQSEKCIANIQLPRQKQAQKSEPITGVSSVGYKGKGMIQSKPRKGPPPDEDDE